MELIVRLWKNFKVQSEIWFFYGFLLTFTLTIRKVLWFFPLRGEFNEYAGIYLYLSDVLLALTLVAWIYTILYNKIDILSMLKNVRREALLLPLVLVIWSFISLIWTENKIISIFRSIKILEFYLLYIFVVVRLFYWNTLSQKECSAPAPCCEIVPRGTISQFTGWNILRKTFGLILFIGLFQAIIGIIQFLLQHSIGLFWLKESLISLDIAGVAKVILNGETFVRAYGLFPHPNILGGFLLFSIIISFFWYKMFQLSENVPRGTFIFKLILGIQLLALFLTFSKSAILGLILGLIYYTYNIVPRGTIIEFIRRRKKLIIVAGLVIIFSFIIAKPDMYSFFIKSLSNRAVYVNVSRGTILDNPILGVGNGQFVISMENLAIIKENWMLEPVHNVFLLVWSELGLVGLLLLIYFMWYVFKNSPPAYRQAGVEHSTEQVRNMPELAKIFSAVFIGFLFVMFFDHYMWDIQQGSFLLWMTMGFLVGAVECKGSV